MDLENSANFAAYESGKAVLIIFSRAREDSLSKL